MKERKGKGIMLVGVYQLMLRKVARIRKMAKSATASEEAAALEGVRYHVAFPRKDIPVAIQNPYQIQRSASYSLRNLQTPYYERQQHTSLCQQIHISPIKPGPSTRKNPTTARHQGY